jgi:N-methylhydantoinase B/oxoprolinase/acetone carboxylase alpha subunit
MSLEETKEFIAEKEHLPNIPSTKEVTEEGLDLAQMQLLQMEKIEEMYLHMMEMNDQINALQNEVTDLRSENEQLKNK